MKTTDQFKQRVSLCHTRLVEDHVGYAVNQPCLPLLKIVEK